VETARAVQRKRPGRWVIFGAPGDQALAAEMAAAIGSSAANLAGQTSLAELILLLKSCRLLLTNDSGPMHLAAALGVPVVVPFGSTAPELTGPWLAEGGRHHVLSTDVPCAPCFRRTCPIDFRCMRNIPVDDVVSAAVTEA
jgi:heptosyltransferase-2